MRGSHIVDSMLALLPSTLGAIHFSVKQASL